MSPYSCVPPEREVIPAPERSSKGFCVLVAVLRTKARAASGAARKETATRYAERLGGSSRIIRAAGRIIKPRGRQYPICRMMIPFAGVKPSLSTLSGVGGSLGEI